MWQMLSQSWCGTQSLCDHSQHMSSRIQEKEFSRLSMPEIFLCSQIRTRGARGARGRAVRVVVVVGGSCLSRTGWSVYASASRSDRGTGLSSSTSDDNGGRSSYADGKRAKRAAVSDVNCVDSRRQSGRDLKNVSMVIGKFRKRI